MNELTIPAVLAWDDADNAYQFLLSRVRRGVAFLDIVAPTWRNHVEVLGLDLGSICDCVLGQLRAAHDVTEDLDDLDRDLRAVGDGLYPTDLGFDFDRKLDQDSLMRVSWRVQYDMLTEMWTDAINRTGDFA